MNTGLKLLHKEILSKKNNWKCALVLDSKRRVVSGSTEALAAASINELCRDMSADSATTMHHEVFVQCGSCYYYTGRKQFMAASQPVVRVNPAIPLRYKSNGWDFGWLMPRSDGHVARWLVDSYTLKFHRSEGQYAMRWFVR